MQRMIKNHFCNWWRKFVIKMDMDLKVV